MVNSSPIQVNPAGQTGIKNKVLLIICIFIAARLVMVMSSSLSGLLGFGDFVNFVQLAGLKGWPFFNYWVEFPPVFPFINAMILKLAGGQEQNYDYLLYFLLTLVDVANLWMFVKINSILHINGDKDWREYLYLLILISFPYTWWYFDEMAVLGLLLGIYLLLLKKDSLAGLGIALGTLTKIFPVLLLVIPWRYFTKKKALLISVISLGMVAVVYTGLYLLSPTYTKASIQTLTNKGSWETVWALIDGNDATGNFGPYAQRLDPDSAHAILRNPPVINPLISLIVFGGLGFWAFLRKSKDDPLHQIEFLGFTYCLFFLWSQGWSPQWVLFLIPLILLTLPFKQSSLFSTLLIFVCLLEWPVLYSRGLTNLVWLPIVIRTSTLLLLGIQWFQSSVMMKPAL